MVNRALISAIVILTLQNGHSETLKCALLYDNQTLNTVTRILSEPAGKVSNETLEMVRLQLGLDEINFKYLQVLFKAYSSGSKSKESNTILIADHNNLNEAIGSPNMVVTTAVASKDLMKSVPVTQYSQVLKNSKDYAEQAKNVKFWVKKLMAGTGSGIVRVEFLKDVFARLGKGSKIKIGSKGTDLHAEVLVDGTSYLLSIAEMQILQLLAQSDKYSSLIFHDVVSNETVDSMAQLWNQKNTLNPNLSLKQSASQLGHSLGGPTIQYHIPTLNTEGNLTRERMAPAGHGLFPIEAIASTLNGKLPKTKKGEDLIGVIGNGEDLMSTPSPEIIGWMAKEEIPLLMVTTEKTGLDKQGGQIAIGFNKDGSAYVTIVEKAQAETAVKKGFTDQMDLFSAQGLRPNDNQSMFNTNMVLINFKVLQPKLEKLAAKVGGADRLLELIAPDLITNDKEQTGADGIKKVFKQLEGAMGSVILKLDRLYRSEMNGEPLVHFLNIGKEHRTQFFAPIKTGFDFFMQFYSDRFLLDAEAMKIVDQRPGEIPKVNLGDAYYKEAAHVLSSFKGAKILNLNELTIEGIVDVPGLELKGKVAIYNKSGIKINLPEQLQKLGVTSKVLENVSITIDVNGVMSID